MQAKILCTATRAKKVVLCLLLGSMIAQLSAYIPFHLAGTLTVYRIQDIVFSMVLPLAVLVINVIVVREVRQASHNASANLGRQQHQQLASSSVPTVMLVSPYHSSTSCSLASPTLPPCTHSAEMDLVVRCLVLL